MQLKLAWLNCFLLILPLLAWNIFLGPKITDHRITSDAHSPKWLLFAENISAHSCLCLSLLIPLQIKDAWSKAGLGIYSIGTLVYFASWLPLIFAPLSAWSNSRCRSAGPTPDPLPVFSGHRSDRRRLAIWGFIGCVYILPYLARDPKSITEIPGFCQGF